MTVASERMACVLCGRPLEGRRYQLSDELVFSECATCRVAIRVRPSEGAALYDDQYSRDITAGFRSEGTHRHARATLRRIATLFPKRGSLLDVGCAGGEFLLAAQGAGWFVRGVEMQARSANLARSRGLTVYSPGLHCVPAESRFDVITLLDVIEHLPDPAAFVLEVSARLKPHGVLYIETPNYGSIFRRLMGGHWLAFLPQHECLYTVSALRRLLARAQFQVVYGTSYACSFLSYDGMRRLRIHRTFYDAGVLAAAAMRRVGFGPRALDALKGAGRAVGTLINWPTEQMAAWTLIGDQLILAARREPIRRRLEHLDD